VQYNSAAGGALLDAARIKEVVGIIASYVVVHRTPHILPLTVKPTLHGIIRRVASKLWKWVRGRMGLERVLRRGSGGKARGGEQAGGVVSWGGVVVIFPILAPGPMADCA
jgi:hypothetical protein